MSEKRFGKKEWLVLVLFGLVGQIAWSVENMYFNLFVFETVSPSLETVTLMVQLSGIVATVATLVAGTLSDKLGNRRIRWVGRYCGFVRLFVSRAYREASRMRS